MQLVGVCEVVLPKCEGGILGQCLLVRARGCHLTCGGRVPDHVSPLIPSRCFSGRGTRSKVLGEAMASNEADH